MADVVIRVGKFPVNLHRIREEEKKKTVGTRMDHSIISASKGGRVEVVLSLIRRGWGGKVAGAGMRLTLGETGVDGGEGGGEGGMGDFL